MRHAKPLAALALITSAALAAPLWSSPADAEEAKRVPAKELKLKTPTNQMVDIADFKAEGEDKGSVVLVSFWATWCAPCIAELRYVSEIYDAWHDEGLEVLAVSIDDVRSVSKVRPTMKSKKWNFTVLLDTDTKVINSWYPSKNVPYSELVDHEGSSVWSHAAYAKGDECEYQQVIADALAARNGAPPATMPLSHCAAE